MFLQFALLFCYVNSFTQFQKNTNNYRIKSTILSSSLKPNTFSFSETSSPPKGQDIDANQQDGLEILLPNADTVEMTNAELRQEWKNILEELKQSTTLPFYLRNVLPAFYSDQAVFKLKSSDDDKPVVDQNELYLTEVELRRLWQEMSFKSFGKPITKFNVLDSLLLLPDEEEEDVMGEDTLYDISLQMNYLDSNTNKQSLALDSVVESVDPFEYVFTTEELQRAWNERAEVSWGLPAKSFSEQAALLLLSEDDDDELYEDDAESLLGGSSSRIEFVSVLENDVDETDEVNLLP